MTMDLYNRVLKLCPSIKIEDFDLQDNTDGNGPFIAAWRSDLTQPTDAEIASVDDTAPLSLTMSNLRQERDNLLAATDWWGASDNTMTDAQTAYRLALRNYPATFTADNSADWPTKP